MDTRLTQVLKHNVIEWDKLLYTTEIYCEPKHAEFITYLLDLVLRGIDYREDHMETYVWLWELSRKLKTIGIDHEFRFKFHYMNKRLKEIKKEVEDTFGKAYVD
jgi:hypothetical protein